MKMVGLFAGIGGIEEGFRRALGDSVDTALLCENWSPAQAVLRDRFPDVEQWSDVGNLPALPADTTILSAGFPCTDLSQAGRTAGIEGTQSRLVSHVFRLLRDAPRLPTWLVIENVPNMLVLDRGRAMVYLVDALESVGLRWAYRVVDARATGLPQRRRRVILVASAEEDPSSVLFTDDAGEPPDGRYRDDAFGFYWTEGRGGLGWAVDAVPTLKGGSTVGIPSPPAVWLPEEAPGRRLVVPAISDAERLQGFPAGWTSAASTPLERGPRWKLVGNAVPVNIASWLAGNITEPVNTRVSTFDLDGKRWPIAARGCHGRWEGVSISEFPVHDPYEHLIQVIDTNSAAPLSRRAAAGFWSRLSSANLGRHPGFRDAVHEHVDVLTTEGLHAADAWADDLGALPRAAREARRVRPPA